MTDSILSSVKKAVNVLEDDDSFDSDLILHINSVLSIVAQLGVGPLQGFRINGPTETWSTLLKDDNLLNMVPQFVAIRVRLMFDPPATSFTTEAFESMARELEWRINVSAEEVLWTDPTLP